MPIPYDTNDLQSLALCIWKEARGEGNDGMRAVAHVIMNRCAAWYVHVTDPVHYAVYAKNQFTSMSVPSDPEFNLEPGTNDSSYSNAVAMCGEILDGTDEDTTQGALYYANLREVTSGWFVNNIVKNPAHPMTVTIGKQTFFK